MEYTVTLKKVNTLITPDGYYMLEIEADVAPAEGAAVEFKFTDMLANFRGLSLEQSEERMRELAKSYYALYTTNDDVDPLTDKWVHEVSLQNARLTFTI